jgi:hypothetical protein
MLAVASAAFASGRRRLTAFCRRDRHKQCRRQVKTGKLANQAKLCARFVPPSGPTCLGDKNPEPHSASGACSLTLTASRGPSAMRRLSRLYLKRIELTPARRQTVAHVFTVRIREGLRGR